ncbi:hypothetical protein [Vibrio phage BX-1]|nr:hypothetical protein [Vibrio phage BX-1]
MSTQVKNVEMPYGLTMTGEQVFEGRVVAKGGIKLEGTLEFEANTTLGTANNRLTGIWTGYINAASGFRLNGGFVFDEDGTTSIGTSSVRANMIFAKGVDLEDGLIMKGGIAFTDDNNSNFGSTTKRAKTIFTNAIDIANGILLKGGLSLADGNTNIGSTTTKVNKIFVQDAQADKVSVGSEGVVGTTSLKFTTNTGVKLQHVIGANTYDIYTTGNKPSWSDVGGTDYMSKSGNVLTLAELNEIIPKTDKAVKLGRTGLRLSEVWSEIYRGKDVDIEGDYKVAGVRQPVWRSGTAAPVDSVGKDGDFYVKRSA